MGAIGNANQITNLLLLVFSVVCTASMILISQYIGAKDTRKVKQIYVVSLAANLVFGLVVSLFLLIFSPWVFRLMGVQAVMFDQACLYMRIIGLGMVFQAVYLTFTAFFRSSQMMKETMVVSVVMNCLNIGGTLLLINGVPAVGLAKPWVWLVRPSPAGFPGLWEWLSSECCSVSVSDRCSGWQTCGPSPGKSCGGCCASVSPPGRVGLL